MLKDIVLPPSDSIESQLADCLSDGVPTTHLREGCYQIGHFNFNHLIEESIGRLPFEFSYPNFGDDYHAAVPDLGSYGVCDSPEQFLSLIGDLLEKDERTFVVSFTHVAKEPENKGRGGGWRWHKWGAYVGTGEPQNEYLDDEDGFEDGVYCFHIYQIAGPILKSAWEIARESDKAAN